MAIEFFCPTCQKKLKTSSDRAGASARCPQCGVTLVVPSAFDAVEAASRDAVFGQNMPLTSSAAADPSFGDFRDQTTCVLCGATNDASAERCYACGERRVPLAEELNARRFGPIWSAAWAKWTANLGICVAAAAIAGGLFLAAYMGSIFLMLIVVISVDAVGIPLGETAEVVGVVFGLVVSWFAFLAVYSYLLAGMSKLSNGAVQEREASLAALFPSFGTAIQSLLCTLPVGIGLMAAMLPGLGGYFYGAILIEEGEPIGIMVAILGYAGMCFGWGLGWTVFWPVHYAVVEGRQSFFAPLSDGVRIACRNFSLSLVLALVHMGLLISGLLTCYVGLLFAMPLSFMLFAVAYDRCAKSAAT